MSEPKWKHRACPCGCGEMADECMKPTSGLNAFRIACCWASPVEWHDIGGGLGRCDNCGTVRSIGATR